MKKTILLLVLMIGAFSFKVNGQALNATINVQNVTCAQYNNGVIHVNPFGGVSPYNISWDGGVTFLPSNITAMQVGAGNYFIVVKDAGNNTYSQIVMVTSPLLLNLSTTINNDVITFNANGGTPPYVYTLDGMQYFSTNVIAGVQPGNYNAMVQDSFGCFLMNLITVLPSVPLINNSTQVFAQGSTLADIQVTGQNIKWYATQSGLKTMSSSELPLSTVLVNGATYYVSQTVNGVESNKIGITTQVGSLSANEFDFQKLEVYPIPVEDVISIKNISKIKKVTFFNYLGAKLFSKNINEEIFNIDLTVLSKGVYFLKLESDNSEKIVKFVKE